MGFFASHHFDDLSPLHGILNGREKERNRALSKSTNANEE